MRRGLCKHPPTHPPVSFHMHHTLERGRAPQRSLAGGMRHANGCRRRRGHKAETGEQVPDRRHDAGAFARRGVTHVAGTDDTVRRARLGGEHGTSTNTTPARATPVSVQAW